MQTSKWGWPAEQGIVGGHGKHIMALACNDTLLVDMCDCVRCLKIARVTEQHGMGRHKSLSLSSLFVFYCTELSPLTAETPGH